MLAEKIPGHRGDIQDINELLLFIESASNCQDVKSSVSGKNSRNSNGPVSLKERSVVIAMFSSVWFPFIRCSQLKACGYHVLRGSRLSLCCCIPMKFNVSMCAHEPFCSKVCI